MKLRSLPNVIKGYDEVAHNGINSDYNMPSTSANGCAFHHQSDDNLENKNIIETIITLLNTLLTKKYSKTVHVAIIVEVINILIAKNNGCKSLTVKLQQCSI